MPVSLDLIGGRAKVTPMVGGFMTGTLGGAITTDERDAKIYPAFAPPLNDAIAHDCFQRQNPPQCGCTSGSHGEQVIQLFDTDHDCMIIVDELRTNSLMMSLFAPDVTVYNQSAISVGFAVTAVDAIFTP